MGKWFAHAGLALFSPPTPWSGGCRWVLTTCPFAESHDRGEAYVVQLSSGAIAAGCQHDSCRWGWRDLRSRFEPGYASERPDKTDKSPFGIFVSSPPGGFAKNNPPSDQADWPDPTPISSELRPVPSFDLDLLPSRLRPWIEDVVSRMQCPPDYPAIAVMVVLGAIVGRKIAIRPKQHDDWEVVPNLWGGVIGRAGVMKSPAMQEAMAPLRALEAVAKSEFDSATNDFEIESLVHEETKKLAQKRVRKTLESGEDATEAAKEALGDGLPNPPVRTRFITNDATVEKLGELLRENPNGIIVFRDELIGLLKSLDKPGQEGARAFYLESWNGTGSFTYDRILRGTVDIEAAIVSVLGGIQPGPLTAYLRAATQNQGDDGFIQRFQLLVWPDIGTWRNVDAPPNREYRGVANDLLTRLVAARPFDLGARVDEDDPQRRPYVRFSADAQSTFDAYRETLERHIRSEDEPPELESHIAKYRSLIPSLALLIHLAEGKVGDVSDFSLRKALKWGDYLLDHARRIYASVESSDMVSAKALAKKIEGGSVGPIVEKREIYRHGWSNLSSAADVQNALDILTELEWVRPITESTGGAPRTRYLVNPRKKLKTPGEPTDKTDKSPTPDLMSVLSVPPTPDLQENKTTATPSIEQPAPLSATEWGVL